LIDIGGGFGRLSDFYGNYDQVVLLDYSCSLLRQAQERLGRDGRVLYVSANVYAMPFVPEAIDVAMMVRVIHHMEDVPALLAELARTLVAGGHFVLEFASKRHLKAIARYALRRQMWSPFDPAPYEFVEMNFDFHPAWMRRQLAEAGFHVKRQRTVSHFRLPLLKRLVPARTLAAVDGLCQPTGDWWQLTPSVFLDCVAGDARQGGGSPTPGDALFACPSCRSSEMKVTPEAVVCGGCDRRWPIEDGIYNFKTPA
jgi:SAM-dependent methyltransferase